MCNDVAIFIPARLGATRLPNKPLADIAGMPMVIHVAQRAKAANIGPVFIATGDQEIADIAEDHGFTAILTKKPHETGSDRIFEALCTLEQQNSHRYKYIMNLQGDLPNVAPDSLKEAIEIIKISQADIATLATFVNDAAAKQNPNRVKLIGTSTAQNYLRALYFTRAAAPHGDNEFYEHIGIYVYRREALESFIKLPTSALEQRERLEQLRAMEAGLSIVAKLIKSAPIAVDTAEDLENVRNWLAENNPK